MSRLEDLVKKPAEAVAIERQNGRLTRVAFFWDGDWCELAADVCAMLDEVLKRRHRRWRKMPMAQQEAIMLDLLREIHRETSHLLPLFFYAQRSQN